MSFVHRLIAVSLVLGLSIPAGAANERHIATKFADVIMENVQPGKVYNLRTMRNLPYRIVNEGDQAVDVTISIEMPPKGAVKAGYEAIPDLSWIRVIPNKLRLAPKETVLADVILQLPATTAYNNHHYQAHIVAKAAEETVGMQTGMIFGLNLASRLRFSVACPGPDEIRRMQQRGIYQMLNFTLEPDLQFVPGTVEPGKKYVLDKSGVRLSLINRSPQNLKFSLKSVPAPAGVVPPASYEFGNYTWIRPTEEVLKVHGESIKGSGVELELPNDPKLRGKHLVFVIQAGLVGRDIPVEVYSRIGVTVAP